MERRLAAIFYADVAGYTRLTGLDEEDTHRQLTARFDIVSRGIKDNCGRWAIWATG